MVFLISCYLRHSINLVLTCIGFSSSSFLSLLLHTVHQLATSILALLEFAQWHKLPWRATQIRTSAAFEQRGGLELYPKAQLIYIYILSVICVTKTIDWT